MQLNPLQNVVCLSYAHIHKGGARRSKCHHSQMMRVMALFYFNKTIIAFLHYSAVSGLLGRR